MTHISEPILDNNFDFRHFAELGYRIKAKSATEAETDEFVHVLYENGQLTEDQYQQYTDRYHAQEVVNIAISVGATFALLAAVAELFRNK